MTNKISTPYYNANNIEFYHHVVIHKFVYRIAENHRSGLQALLTVRKILCKKNSRQKALNGRQNMFTSVALNMMRSLKYG